MAAICRIGIYKVLSNNCTNKLLSNRTELKVPIRGIVGKAFRDARKAFTNPKPWPYKTKRYTRLNYLFDKTTARFHENTKLIVVEGPVAAGKSEFAKELAEELDMMYFPEANQDMVYTNEYGFNYKKLDPQIPESTRSFDVKDFLVNPSHRLSGSFQLRQYCVKYSQYIDALAHILTTGQGVVLDRCVYSDFVFMEAMTKHGYASRGVRSVYYDLRKNTIDVLLRPHLVIYLDVPVPKVLQNIKRRNIPTEVKCNALTQDYLQTMENSYKQNYLKNISTHSELLVYDWSEKGEVEVVVEDIERIDFDGYDKQDAKMRDWVYHLEEEWAGLRYTYADQKNELMMYTNIARFDVPELVTEAEDMWEFRNAYDASPGNLYQYGYNPKMGDSVLFKTGVRHRNTLPLIERQLS